MQMFIDGFVLTVAADDEHARNSSSTRTAMRARAVGMERDDDQQTYMA